MGFDEDCVVLIGTEADLYAWLVVELGNRVGYYFDHVGEKYGMLLQICLRV